MDPAHHRNLRHCRWWNAYIYVKSNTVTPTVHSTLLYRPENKPSAPCVLFCIRDVIIYDYFGVFVVVGDASIRPSSYFWEFLRCFAVYYSFDLDELMRWDIVFAFSIIQRNSVRSKVRNLYVILQGFDFFFAMPIVLFFFSLQTLIKALKCIIIRRLRLLWGAD